MRKSICLALLALIVAPHCSPVSDERRVRRNLAPAEGFIDVQGGKIWYEIAGAGQGTPLLLLHGGPGGTCRAFEPLRRLGHERPVIFYDQLGCGKSDRPDDTSLWNVARFGRELQQVRDALGLAQLHIFGHSWGTALAVEYMLSKPEGVGSLILASPLLSAQRWLQDTNRLKAELPEGIREIIDRHEEAGTTDSEEYQAATMEFYKRYLCRLNPWPPELEECFAGYGWDVYFTMWGPSEFHATGNLKDFDRTDRLKEIGVPTLFTAGRYDEATPQTVEWYQSLLPGSSLEIFANSAHMTMLEEPERFVQVIRNFLHSVERITRADEPLGASN